MTDTTQARPQRTIKRDVLEELGEQTLLLPALINSALAANDRAKYLLSLLQAARSSADAPSQPYSSLREERLAAGIGDVGLDEVVARSRRISPGRYLVPQARRIHKDLTKAIGEMLAPLIAAQAAAEPEPDLAARRTPEPGIPPQLAPGGATSAPAAPARTAPARAAPAPAAAPALRAASAAPATQAPSADRLDALLAQAPDLSGDQVSGDYIDAITSARREHGDSLHLLVMDAHRELTRLQARIATGRLHGAAVYGLARADHGLVTAFMAGLAETAPLKFDHPGLATTATRVGQRLLIQNDLGTTSAHVVVIAVEGLRATITYTDVHLRRLRFFESLLEKFAVRWSDAERRQRGPALGEHHVTTGLFEAANRADLESYLRYVGSRLVFVLDWNRARKRLSAFLSQADACEVLRWAADNNVGHMAFLALGGERMLYDAVELAAKVPARYGEPLSEVLGHEATLEATRFALRAAAEGMLAGQSQLLIRDKLRVEVLKHVQASQRQMLDAGAEHASLIVETAQALQGALARLGTTPDAEEFLHRVTVRAAGWEHRADEILVGQRQAARRVDGGDALAALTASADDAIDSLEETIFLLTLVPREAAPLLRPILQPLAVITSMAAREHLKVTEIACQVVDGPAPEDLEDFLVAVDRVSTLEHEADTADRMARAALVSAAPEFRSLYVADSVSRGAEDATDALLRSAFGLRDHILGLLPAR